MIKRLRYNLLKTSAALLAGLACASPSYAGEFLADWSTLNWPANSIGPETFTITDEFGFELQIRIGITRIGGTALNGYPDDLAGFGTDESLWIVWNPSTGNGNVGDSTNTATFEILSGGTPFPVDNLVFDVSDIDAVDNNSTTDRCDFVTLTGNAGNPTLAYKLTPSPATTVVIGPGLGSGATGALAANQAQCVYNTGAPTSPNSNNDDNGTIIVTYPAGTHSLSIAYDESISDVTGNNSINPAARGGGFFASTIISSNSTISLVKSTTSTGYNTVGDTLTYDYTITNDGPMPINTGQNFQISDDKIGIFNCGTIAVDIPVGGTHSCSASYTVVAADITNGQVTNIATAGLGTGAQAFADRLQSNNDQVTIVADRDLSDAPISGTSYGEASHQIIPGTLMGANIDADTASLANATATGDDTDIAVNDEDGVSFPTLYQGASETIFVDVSGAGGFLQGWIDWDNDGAFDASDQIATNIQDTNSDGQIEVPIDVPSGAAASTFARFRWSTISGLNSTAFANNGEVEDYSVSVENIDTANMSCPAGYTLVTQSGNAGTVVTAAIGSANALGALSAAGSATNGANAARNNSANVTLGLQLDNVVPEGAPITVSIAKNNNAANSNIETSIVNSGYSNQLTFNAETQDIAQRRTFLAPAGGVEFIRFVRNAGSLWIDGVSYSHACLEQAQLSGSKTVEVWDPANTGIYALPGNDVIYTISGSNTGQGPADTDSIVIIDELPSEVEFYNGDIDDGGPETNPVSFTQSSGAGLTFTYATDVGYSNSATKPTDYSLCNYTPSSGYDASVTFICFNPKGSLASGNPDPTFSFSFRSRIK